MYILLIFASSGLSAHSKVDPIGQLAGVTNRWADDASQVAGQRWAFTFDEIGNRTLMKSGGDSAGSNLRDTKYTPTTANRYAGITNSGKFQLMGEADSGTVYITNSSSGVTRHGVYFHKELGLNVAGSGTQMLTKINLTNGSTYAPTITGAVYIAPTNEIPTYTSNGNLLTDGRWVYQWNALDRLTRLDRRNPSDPIERIEFQYDHAGRRTQKIVTYTNAVVVTNKFVYDGWRLIAEMDGGNNLVRSYLWGADLTQSLDGGAGVGGLVGVNIQTNGFYFATSDGRGNVTSLIRAQSSTPSVRYDYSPFGEVIRASGVIAKLNPIRFSSKYYDDEAGLIYYGERYYHPAHGRWVSPDPLGELGGLNLYGFVGNDPYNYYDPYGLALRDWVNRGWLEGLQEGAGNLRNSLAGLIEVPKQALRTVLTQEGREQALHTLNSIRLLLNELPNDPCLQDELKRLLGQEYDTFIAELQTAEGLSRFLMDAGVSGLASGGTALAAKGAGTLNKVIQIVQRMAPDAGGRRGGGGGGGGPLLNVADEVAAKNAERGGLNLFRAGPDGSATREAATGWREGDRMLNLPNQGSPKANWKQNAGRLREEMGRGEPIFDSYREPATGLQIPAGTTPSSGGRFLNAERKLLESRGWKYNPSTGAYYPPGS